MNSALSVQTDLVTVTSHIAHHTAVSSAFTCSSAQQGLYAAASVGRRGSKCIQRAPAETTEARVLLLLLLLLLLCSWPGRGEHKGCWWRRVSGFKRILFFSTRLGQDEYKHNTGVCVRLYGVFIIAFWTGFELFTRHPVCVCCSYPGRQWRAACSVLITTWSYQRLHVCLNTCTCVYTEWK